VAVEVEASSETLAAEALEAAFAAIGRTHELMRPRGSGSDLARLAAARPGTEVAIDPWTSEVLALAREFAERTDGLFDPCLPSAPGRMADLEISAAQVICHKRAEIDLGGIAKGYAVDRAIDALQARGCVSGFVNAGGDLRVFGATSGMVTIRAPAGHAMSVELQDAALAVSAPRSTESPPEHLGFYRGDTGAPVEGRFTAILASSAAVADALCKCALLCDAVTIAKLLDEHGARFIAMETPGA